MRAFLIDRIENLKTNLEPLRLVNAKISEIKEREILIKVHACGVCHTEIDQIEGRITPSLLPVIPGHQITGEVIKIGEKVQKFKVGDRAGAGWIYSSCKACEFCKKGLENLCSEFMATGKDAHGGYAEYFSIQEDYAFHIPYNLSYEEAAPIFCAGAIGYRALMLAEPADGHKIGLVGFGASGHLVLKIILSLFPKSKVFVFARDEAQRKLALNLGAYWAGDIEEKPPEKLNSAIDTTPVWKPPLSVLKHLKPSGRLVINAIRKEDHDKSELMKLDYSADLWLEREIKTVANVTRKDISEMLQISAKFNIKPEIEIYPFEQANRALIDIKNRKIKGAKVLKIGG